MCVESCFVVPQHYSTIWLGSRLGSCTLRIREWPGIQSVHSPSIFSLGHRRARISMRAHFNGLVCPLTELANTSEHRVLLVLLLKLQLPDPKLTAPCNTNFPDDGSLQTSGPPLSPWQPLCIPLESSSPAQSIC